MKFFAFTTLLSVLGFGYTSLALADDFRESIDRVFSDIEKKKHEMKHSNCAAVLGKKKGGQAPFAPSNQEYFPFDYDIHTGKIEPHSDVEKVEIETREGKKHTPLTRLHIYHWESP